MPLNEFTAVSEGPFESGCICREEGCEERAVVDNPYKGKFHPICFHHAFVAALDEDTEAQKLAIGFAAGQAWSDRNVYRRSGT